MSIRMDYITRARLHFRLLVWNLQKQPPLDRSNGGLLSLTSGRAVACPTEISTPCRDLTCTVFSIYCPKRRWAIGITLICARMSGLLRLARWFGMFAGVHSAVILSGNTQYERASSRIKWHKRAIREAIF